MIHPGFNLSEANQVEKKCFAHPPAPLPRMDDHTNLLKPTAPPVVP
jgi:hypothetical protein